MPSQTSPARVSRTAWTRLAAVHRRGGASKAAVVELTRTWAAEFAANNVRVNAVSPGPTTTEGTTETAVGSVRR